MFVRGASLARSTTAGESRTNTIAWAMAREPEFTEPWLDGARLHTELPGVIVNPEDAMSATYRMNLPPIRRADAQGEMRRVLDLARKKLGFVPNMYANMVHSPGLLETYLDGYRRFREHSGFTPPEQEVVFLTISRLDDCAYCMGAHSMLAVTKSKLDPATLKAIRDDEPIEDARLRALATFTGAMVTARGRPGMAPTKAFLDAGYGERHILEIVLAVAVKTLSTYTNHLFETELDAPFAECAWQARKARGAV